MSVVSVYRSPETLCALGLVTRTDLGGPSAEYEWAEWAEGQRHHHLICRECGARQELPDAEMDGRRARLPAAYGFDPAIDHHAIFGCCRACAARSDPLAG